MVCPELVGTAPGTLPSKSWSPSNATVLLSPVPTPNPWDHAGARVTWLALLPALLAGEEGSKGCQPGA